jgi:hypothetical protein
VIARERRNIDVESLLAIGGPCAEDISAVRDEIVERRKHLCKTFKSAPATGEINENSLPSKKSIASVRNSSYVNSNTRHIFGEMLRDLKVRLSTSSYTLSNRSLGVTSEHIALHVSCSDYVPRTFFSRVSWMIGMMTSCTWARISGEESMDVTICRIVSIHVTPSSN